MNIILTIINIIIIIINIIIFFFVQTQIVPLSYNPSKDQ